MRAGSVWCFSDPAVLSPAHWQDDRLLPTLGSAGCTFDTHGKQHIITRGKTLFLDCFEDMTMLDAYVPLLAMVGIAVFIAVFVLSVSRILGPQKATVRKLAPYESGM